MSDVTKMKPVTVRFSEDAWGVIHDMAEESGVPMAELIRAVVDNRLERYLGTVQYIDKEQGKQIEAQLKSLYEVLSKIEFDLNRIGVNYNQEIKLKQIEKKYEGRRLGYEGLRAKMKEIEEAKAASSLDKSELISLMNSFKVATKKAGEELCRIRG